MHNQVLRTQCEASFQQGAQALQDGRPDAAEGHFRQAANAARELPPEERGPLLTPSLVNLGFALFVQQRFEQALEPLAQALEHRQFLDLYSLLFLEDHLADILLHLGHYRRAIAFCEDTVRLSGEHYGPESLEAARRLQRAGLCYLQNGFPHHAVAPLQAAVAVFRSNPEGDLAEALLNLGNALGSDEPQLAATAYHEASTLWANARNPDRASTAWLSLGILYSGQGLYHNALPLFERALAARTPGSPRYANVLNSMAMCRNRMGDRSEARRLIAQALAVDNNNPDFIDPFRD